MQYKLFFIFLFFSSIVLAQNPLLERQTIENQIVVLKNEENLIPVPDLTVRLALLDLGDHKAFTERTQHYTTFPAFRADQNFDPRLLKNYSHLIVVFPAEIQWNEILEKKINKLLKNKKIIGVIIGKKEGIEKQPFFQKIGHWVHSAADSPLAQDLTAQYVFGGMGEKLIRLKYTIPEELGYSAEKMRKIDSLAAETVRQRATPSAQMMVVRDGKVFYWKSFGYTTYDSSQKASLSDLYDLASITKISAATPALMKLVEEKHLDLDKNLGDYLPNFEGTNKKDLKFRELLAHQARLKSWIPFWRNTLDKDKKLDSKLYRTKRTRRFSVQVAENLFLHKKYKEKIYQAIKDSPLQEKTEYLYSDLSFYWYPILVKKLAGQDFEAYLQNHFYKPLGATTLVFNPLRRFDRSQIVPTEVDTLFRKQLLWGYVHDEGAALLGGVSGHAGLFGNVNDLAKLLQMYLQKGEYGGKRYFLPETVAEFTRCQFCETGNRRALGFDRPQSPPTPNMNTAENASAQSFGHSGFTGTYIWVEPAENMIFLFFSNRVNPSRENKLLSEKNFRTILQSWFYTKD